MIACCQAIKQRRKTTQRESEAVRYIGGLFQASPEKLPKSARSIGTKMAWFDGLKNERTQWLRVGRLGRCAVDDQPCFAVWCFKVSQKGLRRSTVLPFQVGVEASRILGPLAIPGIESSSLSLGLRVAGGEGDPLWQRRQGQASGALEALSQVAIGFLCFLLTGSAGCKQNARQRGVQA